MAARNPPKNFTPIFNPLEFTLTNVEGVPAGNAEYIQQEIDDLTVEIETLKTSMSVIGAGLDATNTTAKNAGGDGVWNDNVFNTITANVFTWWFFKAIVQVGTGTFTGVSVGIKNGTDTAITQNCSWGFSGIATNFTAVKSLSQIIMFNTTGTEYSPAWQVYQTNPANSTSASFPAFDAAKYVGINLVTFQLSNNPP
jgi:hypothetical protein